MAPELLLNDPNLTLSAPGLQLAGGGLATSSQGAADSITFNASITGLTGQFRVLVDPNGIPEVLLVTAPATSGNTYSCTRGQSNTPANSHAPGVPCRVILTAEQLALVMARIDLANNFAAAHTFAARVTAQKDRVTSVQTPAFASSFTPDPTLGEFVILTLTGNITINNTASPVTGQLMTIRFIQDATGGRTVTWGTQYADSASWGMPPAANAAAEAELFYDGSNWRMLNGPALDQNGNSFFTNLLTVLAGGLTMTGPLTMSDLIPGATSWSKRNHANSQDDLLVLDGGATTVAGSLGAQAITAAARLTSQQDRVISTQTFNGPTSITPDPTLGEFFILNLTGNVTINNPASPVIGQLVTFQFNQDGTGSRTVSWGTAFADSNWQPAPLPNSSSRLSLIFGGAVWRALSGPPMEASGRVWIPNRLTTSKDRAVSVQTPTFASSFTPDPTLGEIIILNLTGNITINAVSGPVAGQVMTFVFVQDATGNRSVTWNAAYHCNYNLRGSANATQVVSFIFDGSQWQLYPSAIPMQSDGGATTPQNFRVSGAFAYNQSCIVSQQTIAFASTITPDPGVGEYVKPLTLTGAITINPNTSVSTGTRLQLTLVQDGTGGRTVTYGASCKINANATSGTAGQRRTDLLIFDGTTWEGISSGWVT